MNKQNCRGSVVSANEIPVARTELGALHKPSPGFETRLE